MAKFEKGKIFVANDLVDYAEGGVVSKELVHSNAGSVTLFSFDEGQGLSEHLAPFDAFIQVTDGEMLLNVEGTDNRIKAGESFIIPSGARHSVKAERPFKMIITMIRTSIRAEMFSSTNISYEVTCKIVPRPLL